MEDLGGIEGVRVLGPRQSAHRLGCVSLTLEGCDPARLAGELDRRFRIAVRAGLHCAPLAHRVAGTFPDGALRISPGWTTTHAQIEAVVSAIRWLGAHREALACAST